MLFMILFIYITLLGFSVYNHEPWFDEAQAWLLARDAGFFELTFKYLRYEGTPGLWHYLLKILTGLNLPYFSINILSGTLAAISVYLFLRRSPFPMIAKVLYPFTYFAFYQYAVVARSYCLLPLLLFTVAILHRSRWEKPFRYVFAICLLANVSLHGLIIASGILAAHGLDLLMEWKNQRPSVRRNHLISFCIFGAVLIFIIFQLLPPADLITFANLKLDFSHLFSWGIPMLRDSLTTNGLANEENILWAVITLWTANLTLIASTVWFAARRCLHYYLIPITGLCIFLTTVYSNAWHQGTLFYTWIFALWISYDRAEKVNNAENVNTEKVNAKMIKFEKVMPDKDKHGNHSIIQMPALMKAYNMDKKRAENGFINRVHAKSFQTLVTIMVNLVFAVQMTWSYHSFMFDKDYQYSASREAAEYIKLHRIDEKAIYMTGFHSISLLPYFDRNIFCNYHNGQKPAFWLWSTSNNIYNEDYLNLEKYKPDYILMGVKASTQVYEPLTVHHLPEVQGYRIIKLFDGRIFWKNKPFESDSFALYEKAIP